MRCWLLISWKDSNWWPLTWCSRVSRGMYLKNDRYSGIFTVSAPGKFELKQSTGQKTFRNQARENLEPVAKFGKDGLCQICKPTNLRKLLFLHSRSRSPPSKFAGNVTICLQKKIDWFVSWDPRFYLVDFRILIFGLRPENVPALSRTGPLYTWNVGLP